jgi:UDP-glucose 4-epimerase
MMTNFIGTIKMLEASRNFKIKKFVYAASASCYGKTELKVSEKDKINTEHPYGFSKYCGELAVQHWSKVYKLNYNSMRIFNAYGPRSRTTGAYGAVMGVFFKQKLENKPFTIVGSGKQSRDFIHVTDVVRAFFAAAQKKNSNEVFNVATSKPKSINLLTKIIGGKKVNIPNRPGESFKSHANISKIISKLNWKPNISFESGVKELIKSIEDWRQAPLWNKKNIKKATKTWFKFLR